MATGMSNEIINWVVSTSVSKLL